MKPSLHLSHRRGFSITELLVSIAVAGIVVVLALNVFSKNIKIFDQGGEDAKLQMKAKAALEAIKLELIKGGADPCRRRYNASSNGVPTSYRYFAAHPWGMQVGDISFTPPPTANPFQAVIVHYDTVGGIAPSGGTPIEGDCTGAGTDVPDNLPTGQAPHYRPAQANLIFVNNPLSYPDPAVPSGFINCNNFAAGLLLRVPILYPTPDALAPVSVQCNLGTVLAANVDCFHIDYIKPLSAGTCSGGVIEDGVCRMTNFTTPGDMATVDTVRIALTLLSDKYDKDYTHPAVQTACNSDATFPSGTNYTPGAPPTGIPYHSYSLQQSFKLKGMLTY